MPEDQRVAYIKSLWKCDELEKDIEQMAQDLIMTDDEYILTLTRLLYKLTSQRLYTEHHKPVENE